jgi:hypothetical protein
MDNTAEEKESQILNYLNVEYELMDKRVNEYQNMLKKDIEIFRKIEVLEEQRNLIDRIRRVGACLTVPISELEKK